MSEFIQSILGIEFQKLCFVLGSMFFFMSATGGAISVKIFTFPKVDTIGRILFGIFGGIMILVPLLHYATGSIIGLINFEPESPVLQRDSPGSSLIISPAHAAPTNRSQSLKISQRQAASFKRLAERIELAAYVGDVHLNQPNEILLFRNKNEYRDFVDRNVTVFSRDIHKYIRSNDLIFSDFMRNSDTARIKIDGLELQIRLKQVFWFAFGTDSVVLEVQIL